LPFEVSADSVHSDARNSFKGREDHLEEEESNNSRRLGCNFLREVERAEKGRRVQESGEEGEDGEDMDLGDGHQFGRVEVVPVTKLVG